MIGLIEAERPDEGEWAIKEPIEFGEAVKNLVFSEAPPLFKPEPTNPGLLPVSAKRTKRSEIVDLTKN